MHTCSRSSLFSIFLLITSAAALHAHPTKQNDNGKIKSLRRTIHPGDESDLSFSKEYPNLRWIHIDLRAPKLSLNMNGKYPELSTVDIDATSGQVEGTFSGTFQDLTHITVHTTTAPMNIDLRGRYSKEVEAHLTSTSGDIMIYLPSDRFVVVRPKTSSGWVYNKAHFMKKKGVFWNKRFESRVKGTDKEPLEVFVNTSSGTIYLH